MNKFFLLTYEKNIYVEKDELFLSGFSKLDGVITDRFLSFDNNIDILFNLYAFDNPQNLAAICDIDFNTNYHAYASIIFDDGAIWFKILDNTEKNITIFSEKYEFLNKWASFNIVLKDQEIRFLINGIEKIKYKYNKILNACQISFGNNTFGSDLDSFQDRHSFKISDININLDDANFVIIPKNISKRIPWVG